MASSTEQQTFSDPFTTSNNKSSSASQDLPMRTSSNDQTQTRSKTYTPISSESATSHVSIPDGRRNSQGETLHSPTDNWKPNFQRKQSFKFDDLKRDVYVKQGELMAEEPNQGTGFTEGGEGTRKV